MTESKDTIQIVDDGTPKKRQIVKSLIDPSVNAAISMKTFLGRTSNQAKAQLDITVLVDVLREQNEQLAINDLSMPESLLLSQAHTLDAIFFALLQCAHANMGEYLDATEKYMRLALKAQSQSQATLRTLGELKNPKQLAFIKQANMAQGHQQVNNGTQLGNHNEDKSYQSDASRARETENEQNELLEAQDGERLDVRAQTASERTNSGMATLEAVNGTKDSKRQEDSF